MPIDNEMDSIFSDIDGLLKDHRPDIVCERTHSHNLRGDRIPLAAQWYITSSKRVLDGPVSMYVCSVCLPEVLHAEYSDVNQVVVSRILPQS